MAAASKIWRNREPIAAARSTGGSGCEATASGERSRTGDGIDMAVLREANGLHRSLASGNKKAAYLFVPYRTG